MDVSVVVERSALEKATYLFVQDLARALNAKKPIEIPSFPSVAMRVKGILDDENCTPATIARVVGSEPGLAARLLKMANSAALNTTGQPILDLPTAIKRLGLIQIRSSAMSFAMKNLMDARTVEELKSHLNKLWNHSIQVAAICYSLAKRTKSINPDEAMFVGLVHDVGKLYILTRIEEYPEIYASTETIEHILEDWHSVIGKSILENWEFPESIQDAISGHEDLDYKHRGEPDLNDIVIVANLLANRVLSSGAEDVATGFDDVASYRALGLTQEALPEIIKEWKSEIAALETALKG